MNSKPIIRIEYCAKCRWMIRAAWVAQELLSTFENELGGVTLAPSEKVGVFNIAVGDQLLWSREAEGGFAQPKEIKRLVRDQVAPGKDLGHIDA